MFMQANTYIFQASQLGKTKVVFDNQTYEKHISIEAFYWIVILLFLKRNISLPESIKKF